MAGAPVPNSSSRITLSFAASTIAAPRMREVAARMPCWMQVHASERLKDMTARFPVGDAFQPGDQMRDHGAVQREGFILRIQRPSTPLAATPTRSSSLSRVTSANWRKSSDRWSALPPSIRVDRVRSIEPGQRGAKIFHEQVPPTGACVSMARGQRGLSAVRGALVACWSPRRGFRELDQRRAGRSRLRVCIPPIGQERRGLVMRGFFSSKEVRSARYASPMPKDPAVEAYIAKAQPFARPILRKLRTIIRAACPTCEESIKWGMPAFSYHGPFCSIAAFKSHCALTFWKAELLRDPKQLLERSERSAMGHLGRITSLDDLPTVRDITAFLKQAMLLNERGVKVVRTLQKKPPLRVPPEMQAAIRANRAAWRTWEAFSSSHQREYIEWITDAKSATTRERRQLQMLEWLADGKHRNWKYERRRATAHPPAATTRR